MNSDYLRALLFILLLDGFLFLAQQGAISVSADIGNNFSFYDYDGSMINSVYDENGVLTSNMSGEFPTVSQSVSTDSGGVLSYFTERWSAVRSAILSNPITGTVYKIINALPRLLIFMGTPDYLWQTLAGIWHLFTITIIYLLLFG